MLRLGQWWQRSGVRRLSCRTPDASWNVRGKGVSTLFVGEGYLPPKSSSADGDSWREWAMENCVLYDFKLFSAGQYGRGTLSYLDVWRTPIATAAALIVLLPVFCFFCCICLQFCQHWSCQRGHDEITLTCWTNIIHKWNSSTPVQPFSLARI